MIMPRGTFLELGRVLLLAGVALTGFATAEQSAVIIAGGELDSAFSNEEVYRGVPTSAPVPPNSRACDAAKRYVDLINDGQFAEVADLYEDDALLLEPGGAILRGKDQIRKFYLGYIGNMRPEVVAVAYVGDDIECMVELAVRKIVEDQLRYALVSIDHFTLMPGGGIARMVAFARSSRNE